MSSGQWEGKGKGIFNRRGRMNQKRQKKRRNQTKLQDEYLYEKLANKRIGRYG
jgi:hypothetical protein